MKPSDGCRRTGKVTIRPAPQQHSQQTLPHPWSSENSGAVCTCRPGGCIANTCTEQPFSQGLKPSPLPVISASAEANRCPRYRGNNNIYHKCMDTNTRPAAVAVFDRTMRFCLCLPPHPPPSFNPPDLSLISCDSSFRHQLPRYDC